jgi:hypothetical protein
MINIYPINDTKSHVLNTTCDCDPSIIEEYGELIVSHNSYDGREAVEEANEILKKGSIWTCPVVDLAYRSITRIKGKEYSPNCQEIQKWIDSNQERIKQIDNES